jgi:hypothetical protein
MGLIRTTSALRMSVLACSLVSTSNVFANFLEDSQSSIYLRNFYIDKDFEQPNAATIGSWSQGISYNFISGYTNTPIQVGVDASLKYALRLSDDHEHTADTNLPYNVADKNLERDYAKYGLSLKLKYHNTEVKIGELNPKTPVVYIDEARQLPTSYAGIMLESKDINRLKITAGRITRINARNDDSYEKLSLYNSTSPRFYSDGLNLLGLDYDISPHLKTSYWFGQLEDIYQQNYFGASYKNQINPTLNYKIDASYFYNNEDGTAQYGEFDSQAYGLMATLNSTNYSVALGLQKNKGTSIFPTLNGYPPQPFLPAWSNVAFIMPNEFTWFVNYAYDFSSLGFNGLKAKMSYHHGSDIERSNLKDNTETESIFSLLYTVPQGKLKGLGFEWRYTDTDTKYLSSSNAQGYGFKENRIITTYTFKF